MAEKIARVETLAEAHPEAKELAVVHTQDQRAVNDGNDDNNYTDTDSDDDFKYVHLSRNRRIALVITATGASFLNTLSLQSVVIILPTLADVMDIPESRQQWIVSSYSIAFGCFLLIWGRIADIYGKRYIFILGSGLAVVTTALNPLLKNEIAFNIFRALQGFGAAANVPTAIGILGVIFPPGKAKNYAFSAYASGGPLGAVFGNILSGIIANYTSWKWVFWVLAILAAFITAAGILVIPTSIEPVNNTRQLSVLHAVDWIGGTLVTVGLLALLFALTEGNIVGWSTPWVPVLIVVALLLIFVFVVWQWYQERRGHRAPLIKVSVFRNRLFAAACAIMAITHPNDAALSSGRRRRHHCSLCRVAPHQPCADVRDAHVRPAGAGAVVHADGPAAAATHVLLCVRLPGGTAYGDGRRHGLAGADALHIKVSAAGVRPPIPSLPIATDVDRDQALGGALINACGQVGRAIGLAIATAVQTAVMAHERGVSVQDAGKMEAWDAPSLNGIRAGSWFNCAVAFFCVIFSFFTFRGTGIVGKIPDAPSRGGVRELDAERQ